MKQIIQLLMKTVCAMVVSTLSMAWSTKQPAKKIFISKAIDHPALDKTQKGIVDALQQHGYTCKNGSTILIESAQASPALASQIASKFVHKSPHILVAIGTLPAQSFLKLIRNKKIPLVFSTVTDPVGAGLVKTMDQPSSYIGGVSNFVSLEPQIQLFKNIQPGLKRLGILYNAGEVNSVSVVAKLEKVCDDAGLVLVKQTVSKTSEISQATTKLSKNVDAILISNDNTCLGALQNIIAIATKASIPVYVSDVDAMELGALAALGPNQYDIGWQTGEMVAGILGGKDPSMMAVELPIKTQCVINEKVAKKLHIPIADTLIPYLDTTKSALNANDGVIQKVAS